MASGAAQSVEGTKGVSSKGLAVIVVAVVFSSLSFLLVGLRLWARRLKLRALTVNDFMIIAALVFQVGEMIVLILGTRLGGIGYHASLLSSRQTNNLAKIYMAVEPLWISSNSCARISMIHLYTALFSSRQLWIAVYTVAALVVGCWVSAIIRMCLLCTPFAYVWDKSIEGGSCINLRASWISISVIDLVLDFIILVMPMPILWQLRLPATKKFALGGVFIFGLVVCVIAILRIIAITQLNTADMSYSIVYHAIWSALEPSLSIITACLPIMQPVLLKICHCATQSWSKESSGDAETGSWTYLRPRRETGACASIEVRNKGFRPLTAEGIYPPPTNTCSVQPKESIDLGADRIVRKQMEGLQGIIVTQDWDVRTLKEEPMASRR